ncbi:hypothetical protein P171DRAFT_446824 [Karstenula rhodostoma CBS 690.94]|uniref:Uncharacterized protein n=1 Tax=Karstenula rhodostoma CBS 690.94 TaxID=1392251 RepID=A0A9P4U862_9PLEO|nr:hypothetical protein P171DRAFT_446824 [Karstenula rhodostoma CBS 690.94]
MGFLSKLKSAFGSKSRQTPKQRNVTCPAERMKQENPEHFTHMRSAHTVPPVRHWTQSREVDYLDYWRGCDEIDIPTSEHAEYLDYWHDFDGTHIAASDDLDHCTYDISEAGGVPSNTPVGIDLFGPRKRGYQSSHVEELVNFELKRSNALRKKPSPSVVYAEYATVDRSVSEPAARLFSWMLHADEPFPSFEDIMA